ncbi:MAG: hypothetical protein HY877_01015 [Deltaproteobacteria bacterium]|nr:hypothetical protein [Deltaproteobacteria bacterium]
MNPQIFKNLILIGRPASGKSEFIDFMKKLSDETRREVFHLGKIYELDDFLWLWEKFVEDDVWEKAGHRRLFSKRSEHGYVVTESSVLDYCLSRFNEEARKQPQDGTISDGTISDGTISDGTISDGTVSDRTVFIEFARGAGDGGYNHALNKLSDEILKDAVILFIYASYEEACRRNESRYQEKLKHTVLAHKVPDEDMERFGKEIDWLELTKNQPKGLVTIRNRNIPFVTMNNEPELKEERDLSERYKQALDQLCKIL